MTRLIRPLLAAALLLVATLPAAAASREELDASVREAIEEAAGASNAQVLSGCKFLI